MQEVVSKSYKLKFHSHSSVSQLQLSCVCVTAQTSRSAQALLDFLENVVIALIHVAGWFQGLYFNLFTFQTYRGT